MRSLNPTVIPAVVLLFVCSVVIPGPDVTSPGGASSARMEVDAGGITVRIAKKEIRRLASVAELAREFPGLRGEFVVLHEREADTSEFRIVPSGEDREGIPVSIDAGEVLALELIRFLSDYTGLPIVHDSSERQIEAIRITVPSRIPDADDAIVKAMLNANGIRVEERKVSGGEAVLELHLAGKSVTSSVPRERPVIVVGEGDRPGTATKRRAGRPARVDSRDGSYAGLRLESVPKILLAHLDLPGGVGLLVRGVEKQIVAGHPALTALKPYDVITHVDGTRITSLRVLSQILASLSSETTYHLRVIRNGTTQILRLER